MEEMSPKKQKKNIFRIHISEREQGIYDSGKLSDDLNIAKGYGRDND